MEHLERYAVLAALMQELGNSDSWCGETHIQKAAFLAQEMLNVPFGYAFRLYKHGPYSFDLTDELSAMRADAVVEIQPQRYPYGPKLHPTPLGERVIDKHRSLVERHRPALRFVARAFGSKGVAELERLATAYLVFQSEPEISIEEKAQRLRKLKPHIGVEDALSAMKQIHAVMKQANELEAVH